MAKSIELHPDRLFSGNPETRAMARRLYDTVKDLPILSPHGHTDPAWFANNDPFENASDLFIKPDHYVYRMLYSQGVALEDLGIPTIDGTPVETDGRKIWHLFANNFYLFSGTPSNIWLNSVFYDVFGFTEVLCAENADYYYDEINRQLATPEFRPRALFERFNIELIATTESPLDDLKHHKVIQESSWNGQVVTAYRPDDVVDPEYEGFIENVARFGELTNEDISTWEGYLNAHRKRRAFFKTMGATSTDHGHPSATTANLTLKDAEVLYQKVVSGPVSAEDAELFRGQVLTEMARLSIEDGLVMQIHPGSFRNHNPHVFNRWGRDKGCDIPSRTEYVQALKPMLDAVGSEPNLSIILFTLDETVYSRELAPLAGHYPCLKLGPSWWFHDSPEGMRRFRQQVTETAGFYNTVGFNDDTRAFLSIPARHDVARRMDCTCLAELVIDHRMTEDEAFDLIRKLTYDFAKTAYRL